MKYSEYSEIIGKAFFELPADKQQKARKRMAELQDKEVKNNITFEETCELQRLEDYILGIDC